ncbi:MAG TPA: hypothetical protein VFA27_12275 [Vicinamibacterales bacterium]|nr:hypothetical protein [Vicinamibacterales bacterium]
MSECLDTAMADIHKLDPAKRVNYSFGLVLGVDEFLQEQTHLLEKFRRHDRMLHGWGTVCGLKVSVPTDVNPPEVRVTGGLAVSPGGFEICVPNVMCAKLNDWLATNRAALTARFGSFPATVTTCVVLCYRECATDIVPIPGEPCRSDDDAMAPSRIAESFELKLCLPDADAGSPPWASPPIGSPPFDACCSALSAREQGEIEFGRLLRRIDIGLGATPFASIAQLEAAARSILDIVNGALPSPPSGNLGVHPDNARTMLLAIARVWATEVLPELLKRDHETWCGAACERCVPLAELAIAVAADGTVQGGPAGAVVDETQRPILLATNLLQEWLLANGPATV